ncbi:MAG TPA: DUF1731 domain-containing protein [Chloroflexota bacterium]|nr:DUF1731 domain-containing protein [Chloroflexota bacterium]
MKIVLAGGSGQLGQVLRRAYEEFGHEIVILSRSASGGPGVVRWDGRSLGAWAGEVDGADVVINLAGRSVNCRYTKTTRTEMFASRVDSTRVIGQAIGRAKRPPFVWLQSSTATIYSHRFDAPNDELTGIVGGAEPDVPPYWRASIEIAQAWERTLQDAATPQTRKVALRSAMVMGPERGGVFHVLSTLARFGLGGPVAGGRQFVSWIHERDFVRATEFLLARDDLDGPVNLAAPAPLPQRVFMRALRHAVGARVGLPATAWMVGVGAYFLRTDPELILKSRYVAPRRLMDAGFEFEFPTWPDAARDLAARSRKQKN